MSTDTSVSRLAERAFFERRVVRQAATAPRSVCCNAPIQGAARRWCGQCQAPIELDHETHAPLMKARGGAS
jgi:hypothetical protein